MINVHAKRLLEAQEGILAVWQLVCAGLSPGAIRHTIADLREIHDGVYLSGHAPMTNRQRWWAAVVTAPNSTLSHASAAAAHGIRDHRGSFEVVVRPGSGGPQRHGNVLVCRSKTLPAEDIVRVRALPVTSGARTILDLIPYLTDKASRRLVREALRLGATTPPELWATIDRHRGRRGVARLRLIVQEYAALPARRTKSDPELHALELLQAAGRPRPRVNIWIAGEEADLSWRRQRLIIELDAPDFHRFPSEDARKEAAWRAAGWTVHRLPTDDVYDHPDRLLALAPPAR